MVLFHKSETIIAMGVYEFWFTSNGHAPAWGGVNFGRSLYNRFALYVLKKKEN